MHYQSFIEVNPKVMMGKPTIKGTRLTVEFILEELAAGRDAADLISSHPNLSTDNFRAALAFAAASMKNDVIYPIAV